MAYKKRQHYVPHAYLRSWTTGEELITLPIRNGIARKQNPKDIAKKNHLYTLPSTHFSNAANTDPDLKELLAENVMFGTWENRWTAVRDAIRFNKDLHPVLDTIKGFVISQSLRTPKFLRLNKEKIEAAGIDLDGVDDATNFAISGIILLPVLKENCVVEIIQNRDIQNFITSDNPATHWMHDPITNTLRHIGGIALNEELHGNPNYRILCPIHPKAFVVLIPNIGIMVSDEEKYKIRFRPCNPDILKRLNIMVEETADKMLFAKEVTDLSP